LIRTSSCEKKPFGGRIEPYMSLFKALERGGLRKYPERSSLSRKKNRGAQYLETKGEEGSFALLFVKQKN